MAVKISRYSTVFYQSQSFAQKAFTLSLSFRRFTKALALDLSGPSPTMSNFAGIAVAMVLKI